MSASGLQVGGWHEVREADPYATHSHPLELLLFALIPFPLTIPQVNLPLPEIAAAALIARASFRAPDRTVTRPTWFPVLLWGLWAWFVAVALVTGVDGTRRIAHLLIYVLLALCLASGRLHRLSAVRGLAVGVGLGAITGFLGGSLGFQTGYGDRLTGLFSDPNVAGFTMIVLGSLAVAGARTGFRRWIGLVGLATAVTLTLSRTSIIAAILGIIWLVLRRLLPGRWALPVMGALSVVVVEYAADFKQWGPFSDREGSDVLRELILIQERIVLDSSPWIGRGPGTAYVNIDGDFFFFHNSYFALRAEAGWIGLAIFVALGLLLLWKLVALPTELRHPWYEASLIMTGVCAMNLGEVLLEIPAAVAIGIACRHLTKPDELLLGDPRNTPNHVL